MFRISCAQYQIERLLNWESYESKIRHFLILAKQENSNILLLPEYAGIEIACGHFQTDAQLYTVIQKSLPKYINFYQNLAKKYQIYIQPGTIVESVGERYVNRAYFFQPDGEYGYQDKLYLTGYEKNQKIFQQGKIQTIFDTQFGKIGIAICYDCEFPNIVHNLISQGCILVLVPSYCPTKASFNRVYVCSRARAIENQCYMAISGVVNVVDLTDEVDNTFGQANIFGPADRGFPDDGIIMQGKMNEVALYTNELDFQKIYTVREKGEVKNFADQQ